MSLPEIARDLQAQISKSVYIDTDDDGRHRITTPFAFGDGDQPVIAIVPNGDGWMLSDLGNSLFRLGFQLDDDALANPANRQRLSSALSMAEISRRNDELTKPLQNGDYAEALFDFIHALLKIDELGDFGTSNPVRSPADRTARRPRFGNEVANLVKEVLPSNRVIRNWHDPQWDHNGEYTVDFKVNGMPTPLFLHALSTADKTRDATITVYRFNDKQVKGRHIAIFRDRTNIGQRVKEKMKTVCETSFDSLDQQRPAIKEFLLKETTL